MRVPHKITIIKDSNEQYPLLFPEHIEWYQYRDNSDPGLITITVEKRRLSEGDYALAGYEHLGLVERKGAITEIAGNMLSDDYSRARSAFERLAEACLHPYLLLDVTVPEMFKKSRWCPTPRAAIDALLSLVNELGIRVILSGNCRADATRRQLGEFVVRLLLSHALRAENDPVDVLSLADKINPSDRSEVVH